MVDSTTTDPAPAMQFAAASPRGINLVCVTEPPAEGDEPVISGNHDTPYTGPCELRHHARKRRLGVRKARPCCAQKTTFSVDVQLGRANKQYLRPVDLLAE